MEFLAVENSSAHQQTLASTRRYARDRSLWPDPNLLHGRLSVVEIMNAVDPWLWGPKKYTFVVAMSSVRALLGSLV